MLRYTLLKQSSHVRPSDDELEKLAVYTPLLLQWLQLNVDADLKPADARFFSSGEPMPDTLAGLLRSVEPFGAVVSLMGYPEGALHMFVTCLISQQKREWRL